MLVDVDIEFALGGMVTTDLFILCHGKGFSVFPEFRYDVIMLMVFVMSVCLHDHDHPPSLPAAVERWEILC